MRQRVFDFLDGKTDQMPPETQAIVIDITKMDEFLFGTTLAGQTAVAVGYRFPSLGEWWHRGVIGIGENAAGQGRTLPIIARGRPHSGFVHPTGNQDLTYGYGPYPPAANDMTAAFDRCVS